MLKSFVIFTLTFWWLIIGGFSTTDYCMKNLCSSGRKHIACNNTGDFAPACPENQTEMVPMTQSLIDMILDSHNSKREILASGNLPGFEPAAKMYEMGWSDELAYLASLNAKRCLFAHDYCHNTEDIKSSGQNLAKMWWKGHSFTDDEIISTRIDTWWAEYKITNMSQLQAYPRFTEKMIGHFTVMTAEKNKLAGCAAITYPENGMSSMTLCCNYAATNFIGQPMYTPGPTASMCTSGTSSVYPSLCV
ncbi:antigen 5 like allergen Cul n 1-like [Episyrphus balteatus]|uniref:antigen 5 like allergen Cul n 1-like n=1 Tax=Episyrphus balteatus TaxID=286459 RepID=UPI002485BEB2|nr:antigen 5 like allergen Cul n 1-like [Episyrphus balteatus]